MSSAGDTQQSSRVQGARVSSALLCPMESVGPGAKTACVALWIRGALGLWFAAGGVFPFAECSSQKLGPSVQRCLGAERQSWLKGHGGGWAQKAFARRILLPHEGKPVGSGFAPPETPSKEAGPREPGAGQPRFALWRAWGRWRKRLALLSGFEARWGCGLLPEECFTLQNAAARSSFGAIGATGLRR